MFATDYNALTLAAKTRWIKERYFEQSADCDVAAGYNVNINWLNNDERKRAFDKWRRKLQHVTTARNRLLYLYEFVSVCTSRSFDLLTLSHSLGP